MSVGGPPDTMKNVYYMMAMDDVLGMSVVDLAAKYDLHQNRVYMIRKAPAYQMMVEELRRRIIDRTIERQSSLAGKFDAEAPEAFNTIQSIHRDVGMPPGERRKAAIAILDRAPSAPTAKKIDDPVAGKVLQIPEKTFLLFKAAIAEAGETIDVEFDELPEAQERVDKNDTDYFEV